MMIPNYCFSYRTKYRFQSTRMNLEYKDYFTGILVFSEVVISENKRLPQALTVLLILLVQAAPALDQAGIQHFIRNFQLVI